MNIGVLDALLIARSSGRWPPAMQNRTVQCTRVFVQLLELSTRNVQYSTGGVQIISSATVSNDCERDTCKAQN